MKYDRVIVADKYIVSWSGHWMQYALDCAELLSEHSGRTHLVVNSLFGRGAFKAREEDVKALRSQVKLHRVLFQPAHYKKRHPYESLRKKPRSFTQKVTDWFFRPGSIRPVLFYIAADYRAGNFKSPMQLISFFTRYSNPIDLVAGSFGAGVGALTWMTFKRQGKLATVAEKVARRIEAEGDKAWKKTQDRLATANSLRKRLKQFGSQFAGYQRMFSSINPGPNDLVVFTTAELPEIVALERLVAGNARWRQARYKLILRTPVWDREGNLVEPPEEAKPLRKALLELQTLLPNLEMFVDTEELLDQFKALGFHSIKHIPILYGRMTSEVLDESRVSTEIKSSDEPLVVLRSGSAQREKGFLILPDLVKAAQVERAAGGANLRFVFQATMLRYQVRWDRLIATMNALRWINSGDVTLIRKEVSSEDYVRQLQASDIVLSSNRSVPYIHGSTGTTIEALRAGKPLVTMAENWGGRQLRNLDLFVDYIETFADSTRLFTLREEDFTADPGAFTGSFEKNLDHWSPFCHVQPWQIEGEVARRFDFILPPGATHIVALIRNKGRKYPGDLLKIGIQMVRKRAELSADRAVQHIYQFARPTQDQPVWRPFGAGRELTANIWTLRPGTISVGGGMVVLDRRVPTSSIEIEIVVCRNPNNALPISAAGVMADNVFEVSEGLSEVARHFKHYRRTAQEAAEVVAAFHNRDTFRSIFLKETGS